MNYQKLILVGNATSDAQSRKSKKGNVTYTTFGLAVNDASDNVTFFPVTVFGKTGAVAKKYVTKGRQIMVEGRIEVSDNGRFNVVAERVQLGAKPMTTIKKKKDARRDSYESLRRAPTHPR